MKKVAKQHQLVACLVVKEFFTTDYRGIEQILKDSSDLKNILELSDIPHYTTLQKAARRLTNKNNLQKRTGVLSENHLFSLP